MKTYRIRFGLNCQGIKSLQLNFDALITNDRGLEYQQNLGHLPVAVVVILVKANTIEAIRPGYGELLMVLSRLKPGEFCKVALP